VISRTIAIVAMPDVHLLDLSGPLDVFAEANVQSSKIAYRLLIIASMPGYICSSSAARLVPDYVIGEIIEEDVDTLLVAGSPNSAVVRPDLAMVDWLRRVAPTTRRYGSVCAGALPLAETGLLNGRRITTHWAVAQRLAQAFPAITVEEDAAYIRDGPIRTAVGVTAGLDLALALVEEDLGHDVAMRVAAQLFMFFKRPVAQMRFSRNDEAAPAGRSAFQEVKRWVVANPAENHSVANLAERMELSSRHFTRLFRHEVGVTPAAWVEMMRVSAARQMLENGQDLPKQVAARCGFAGADTLRRAFARHMGLSPAEYRRRWANFSAASDRSKDHVGGSRRS
jgi:transcriptional regulator GlxA family with amidase domain